MSKLPQEQYDLENEAEFCKATIDSFIDRWGIDEFLDLLLTSEAKAYTILKALLIKIVKE